MEKKIGIINYTSKRLPVKYFFKNCNTVKKFKKKDSTQLGKSFDQVSN